ncbi:MAG: TetR/AcrR family transcriptional regulator [Pirellulales bacterium]
MSKTDKIIAAAGQRFRYYGIAKTTMQEIAADAGVAVGTLYLYFKNKDDLVVACAGEFVERHRREIAEVLASKASSSETLRRYVLGRFRAAEDVRTGTRHALELTRAVLRLKPDRLAEEGQMMLDTVTRILSEGVKRRQFRIASAEDDAKVFLLSIAYCFPNALSEPPIPPTERDLLLVVDWFLEKWQVARNLRTPSKPRRQRDTRAAR